MQGAAHLLQVKREWGRGAFCRGSFSTSCLVWGGHFLKEDHYPESHLVNHSMEVAQTGNKRELKLNETAMNK